MTSQFYRWFIASKGAFLEHKSFGKFARFIRYITRWLLFKQFINYFIDSNCFTQKAFILYSGVILASASAYRDTVSLQNKQLCWLAW